MIAVIADDLTGAAEIAGIALGFGLRVRLYMGAGHDHPDADLVIVSTDARSRPLTEALQLTEAALRWLQQLHPEFIFKKTDSLLRGHVRDEIEVQQRITGLDRVLLIPANPSLGRTIRRGVYYINETPLAATVFVFDPEYPAKTSMVTQILPDTNVVSAGLSDLLPDDGIIIGDVTSSEELSRWVSRWTPDMMPAGGGDFFSSILHSLIQPVELQKALPRTPLLFVKGTAFDDEHHPIRQASDSIGSSMLIDPVMIVNGPELYHDWVSAAAEILSKKERLFIGFDHHQFNESSDPVKMRIGMAEFVSAICSKVMPAELFIEGGSSAQALLDRMSINNCSPTEVWSRGVVRLDTIRLAVTVKPGSYPLPDALIELFA